jgi:AcrR family transcriptional regulator
LSRDEIVQLAWRLFEKQGFQATTMTEIALDVGLSRRSIFNHFPTKEALLFPSVDDFLSSFATVLAAQPKELEFFDAMTGCVLTLEGEMDALQSKLNPGPEVQRARLSEEAIAYTRELWAREMQSLARTRLQGDPDADVKAGFVAAIVAQVWTEMAKLVGSQPELSIPEALQRVTRNLASLFGMKEFGSKQSAAMDVG